MWINTFSIDAMLRVTITVGTTFTTIVAHVRETLFQRITCHTRTFPTITMSLLTLCVISARCALPLVSVVLVIAVVRRGQCEQRGRQQRQREE